MKLFSLFPGIALFGLAGALSYGQEVPMEQKLEGPCSVQIVGSNNQVFTCKGMDEKLGNQILQIVNRIASNQLDPGAVMAKLDEIQKGVDQIRDRASPRILDEEALQRIVERLSVYRGQRAQVTHIVNDNESTRLAARIRAALRNAGWTVGRAVSSLVASPFPLSGIRVAAAQETEALLAVIDALSSEGLSVQKGGIQVKEPDLITIMVLSKQ